MGFMQQLSVGQAPFHEVPKDNCVTPRSKRELSGNSTSEIPAELHELPSEVASISFRIMLPANSTIDFHPHSSDATTSILPLAAVAVSLIMLVALAVLVAIIKLYRTKPLNYDEYRSD